MDLDWYRRLFKKPPREYYPPRVIDVLGVLFCLLLALLLWRFW